MLCYQGASVLDNAGLINMVLCRWLSEGSGDETCATNVSNNTGIMKHRDDQHTSSCHTDLKHSAAR